MKIRCVIVDDEPLALDLLESYVRKTPFLELKGRCNNAFEALNLLEQEDIDLLFLDIQMPELSGLQLSRAIRKEQKVIFTTAFEQYALEGFKVDALDYLLKPFSYEEFLNAAVRAKEWFGLVTGKKNVQEETRSIFVKSDYKLVRIELEDILYIEGLKDYAKIWLQDKEKPVMTIKSMKAMEELLPQNEFMRVHRSFIVNLSKIKTIERNRIVFGKEYIPVSDNYKEKFQEFLKKHFFE
ncbi:MAG: LytTR family DNA-binding domain-containing protein [Bacteroidetes bacterium]|nr:LytTR family DNA-binding domain-containing protein [Bacteroidota bacterium]